jgi:hypothetical protein
MVITLFNQEAVTPAGRPIGVPIPVAPVVVMVMEVSAEPAQTVGLAEGALAVLRELTITVETTGVPWHSFKVGVMV